MTNLEERRETAVAEPGGASLARLAGKYLTFKLGAEEYGLGILKVREIIGLLDITAVPRTPDYVRGVINLRGKVVPVVDLRVKFGLPEVETTEQTCIIVVDVRQGGRTIQMGVMVDQVSEVRDLPLDALEPAPEFGLTVDTSFMLGMGKVEQNVLMLLDVDRVLSSGELDEVGALTGSA
jgi:purine-binding chemotaxis protein CheW